MSDEVRDKLIEKVTDYGFVKPDLVFNDLSGCGPFNPDLIK